MNVLTSFQDVTYKNTTAYPKPGDRGREPIIYCALAMAEETGEALGKIKKAWRRGEVIGPKNKELTEAVLLELGDVLWYLSRIALEFGLTLEDVAQANLNKTAKRRAEGTVTGEGDHR